MAAVDVFTDAPPCEVPNFAQFEKACDSMIALHRRLPLALPPSRHEPCFQHSDYLRPFIVPSELQACIQLAVRALHGWRDDFDAIAFRGMSGALIGPPVALAMGKTIILVRKEDEDSHAANAGDLVEGDAGARTYIVLDDFMSSGRTYRKIKEAVATFAPLAVCLGLLDAMYITQEKLADARGGKYPLRTSGRGL